MATVASQPDIACTETGIREQLLLLDGASHEQKNVIAKALRKLTATRKRALVSYAKATLATASELQTENWIVTWRIPETAVSCTGADVTSLCTTKSHGQEIQTYEANAETLREILDEVLTKGLRSRTVTKRQAASFRKLGDARLNQALTVTKSLPRSTTLCK